jgi:hypothetical protein
VTIEKTVVVPKIYVAKPHIIVPPPVIETQFVLPKFYVSRPKFVAPVVVEHSVVVPATDPCEPEVVVAPLVAPPVQPSVAIIGPTMNVH